MSCRGIIEMMCASLDEILDPRIEAELSRHLDDCGGCLELWRLLHLMSRHFENTVELVPPSDFTCSVLARLDSLPRRPGSGMVRE